MDMPPSRYRVVERGRRLIVIDSQTGAPASGLAREDQQRIDALAGQLRMPEPGRAPPARTPPSRPAAAPSRPQPGASTPLSGGENTLTTQPWFDDKAPRSVRIDSNGQKPFALVAIVLLLILIVPFMMFGWPALLVTGFLLLQGRKALRAAMTRWLDGFDPA